jgi:hypothetical protein
MTVTLAYEPLVRPYYLLLEAVGLTLSSVKDLFINSSPAIMPLAASYFGVIFLRGHISLKNGTFFPLFSHDTTFFKSTCHLTRLKVLPDGLYGKHLHCELGQ